MRILLLELLVEPERCTAMAPADWDLVVPQARNSGLLGSLGMLLQEKGLLADIPEAVRRHFESVVWIHRKQCENLNYEVSWLCRAMGDIGQKLILLKGAAYLLAGMPPAPGRLITDIDILVPQQGLTPAEDILCKYGWETAEDDPYNDKYYRKWMHEIPPMAHRGRQSVLDVHHTILPPTADEKLDPAKLFEDLVEIRPGIYTLSSLDMVLHSATHLFHEGEFHHGLRDLLDLDRLLRHFATLEDDFWGRLVARAAEMGMGNSLYYALRYSRMFLSTPVDDAVVDSIERGKSRFPGVGVMDFLFRRALLPEHPSCTLPFTPLAKNCLYVRSHYLRMPLYLLLPHLVRKAWMARFGKRSSDEEAALEDQ